MTKLPGSSLEEGVLPVRLVEDANKAAIGKGWLLIEEFSALHLEALRGISTAAGSSPSISEQATILLTCVGLNIYSQVTSLLTRGFFEVSALLLRALMDTQSLLYACISRAEYAEKFMNGDLRASDARRLLVDDIRSTGDLSLANDIEARFRDDGDAANELAHISLLHADKLVRVEGGAVTPLVGARIDEDEAHKQSKVVLDQEHWLLVHLKAFGAPTLRPEWIQRFDATAPVLIQHIRS